MRFALERKRKGSQSGVSERETKGEGEGRRDKMVLGKGVHSNRSVGVVDGRRSRVVD